MEIYLELLLLDNLVMNLAILFLCRRLLSDHKHLCWLWLSALLGAVYAVFMPLLPVLAYFICKLILAGSMVLIGFTCRNVKRFLFALLCFFGCTFVAIGAAIGLYYLSGSTIMMESGAFYTGSSLVRGALYALVFLAVLGKWLLELLQKRHMNGHTLAQMEISTGAGAVAVTALMDSGNMLTEKKSGLPVAVVQRSSIQKILPDYFKSTYEGGTLDAPPEVIIIPYRSLGKKQGALLGFMPGQVKVVWEQKTFLCACAIGVCEEPLSGNGDYEAILHPLMLKEAEI